MTTQQLSGVRRKVHNRLEKVISKMQTHCGHDSLIGEAVAVQMDFEGWVVDEVLKAYSAGRKDQKEASCQR